MTDPIGVGERVTWRDKGKPRIGTVEAFTSWSAYVYVKPDKGNQHFVSKARLTRIADGSGEQEVTA